MPIPKSRPALAAAILLSLCAGESVAQAQATDQRYNVPPPQDFPSSSGRYIQDDRDRVEDDRYAREAEDWATANCVAERRDNATTGAVIGGLIGALAGSGLARGGARAPAAVLGAGAGAAAGASIGKSTSPECPPGYSLRPNPAPFYAPPFRTDVVYVAPAWYDPWVWYGGHWLYRPYPYHRFWYVHHWHRP